MGVFLTISLFLITVTILLIYKRNQSPEVKISRLRIEINKINPYVRNRLERDLKDWQETLNKFLIGDRMVKPLYKDKQEIIKIIEDIQNDLDLGNKIIKLSEKYRHDLRKTLEVTTDYYAFLICKKWCMEMNAIDAALGGYQVDTIGKENESIYRQYVIRMGEIKKRLDVLINEI